VDILQARGEVLFRDFVRTSFMDGLGSVLVTTYSNIENRVG